MYVQTRAVFTRSLANVKYLDAGIQLLCSNAFWRTPCDTIILLYSYTRKCDYFRLLINDRFWRGGTGARYVKFILAPSLFVEKFTLKITFSSDLSRVFRALVFLLVKRKELLSFSFEHSLGLKSLICTFDDVTKIRSSHVRSKCCKSASAKDLLMLTIL